MSPIQTLAERAFVPAAEAVAAGRIPGAVLGLVGRDGARAIRYAGWASLAPEREALTASHWFDLASLTKVIFTTPAILRLCDEGRVSLDDSLASIIPDLRQYDVANAPERRLTLRQCLAHQTHLPAVEPLYTYGTDPATLRAFVLQREWRRLETPVYSDINFILLGIAIERLTGKPLLQQALPPGLSWSPDPARCAATERCSWRGRVLRGTVHDENAYALGGAAGHAGLFGTIDGVLDAALGLLDGSFCSDAAIRAMRSPTSATRGLGWERAHPGWSGGSACSPETIGHVGFTGTGLWIDFSAGLAWSLLTNRVHPTRHGESGIAALRRAVSAALMPPA